MSKIRVPGMCSAILVAIATVQSPLCGQAPETSGNNSLIIDLADALKRAAQFGTQMQAANTLAQLAHEDKVQARAATLPNISGLNQFIYTEGNGTASGVFVANDGVHVYNEQIVLHEDLFALLRRGDVKAAAAAEIAAKAKADVAARGLKATVFASYYAIASAQHKHANARRTLDEAQAFLDVTQKQERGGEAAHADVIKARIEVQQRTRELADAMLATVKAKIALAILIFPSVNLAYEIKDDLDQIPELPVPESRGDAASSTSPDILAAKADLAGARIGIRNARSGYLPSFTIDFYYGIDANEFAATSDHPVPESGRSTLPDYLVTNRHNLGYSGVATLTIPLWSWGSVHSKVKQAQLKERQASLELGATTKQFAADLETAYQEAGAASRQLPSLHSSSDLAAESLRLTLLRYQAGEATTLEVVDAQSTASLARGAYDDGLVRYHLAWANLQTMMGKF